MKKIIIILSVVLFSALAISSVSAQIINSDMEQLEAEIIKISEKSVEGIDGSSITRMEFVIRILSGENEGEEVSTTSVNVDAATGNIFEVGDKVIVNLRQLSNGEAVYEIVDFKRETPILILFVIFVLLTIFIARKQGLFALLSLGISFIILFEYILPQLLEGKNAILITISAAAIIIPINFFLSHGVNKKTTIAILGTLITLVLIGLMTEIFVDMAKLSGFTSDEAIFLRQQTNGVVNIQGVLLASIILAYIGVLDDITISQSAIAFELNNTSKKLNFWQLYSKTMNIGRDHIASLVNTLILVYTGTALPLLLLFVNTQTSFGDVVNREFMAEEIVRTLLASIGLILAVPITTLIACLYLKKTGNLIVNEDDTQGKPKHIHTGHAH